MMNSNRAKKDFNSVDNVLADRKYIVVDIPVELHRKIKSQCYSRGVMVLDEIRALLKEKYSIQ